MKLDDLVKTASLVGGFIIFLGALYLHSYYYYFNIPIFRYLDFSDILVAFLPPLIFIVLFFGSIFIAFYVLIPIGVLCVMGVLKLIFYTKYLFRKQVRVNKPRTSINPKIFININLVWLGLYSVACVKLFLNFYIDRDLHFDDSWFFIMEFSALSIALQLIHKNSESMKIIFANIVLTFLISTLHSATQDIQEARTGMDYNQTTYFITDKDTICTDVFRHYIGKTSGYIFLYNNQNRTAEIYPTSNIKKFVHKENSNSSAPIPKKDTTCITPASKETLKKDK